MWRRRSMVMVDQPAGACDLEFLCDFMGDLARLSRMFQVTPIKNSQFSLEVDFLLIALLLSD